MSGSLQTGCIHLRRCLTRYTQAAGTVPHWAWTTCTPALGAVRRQRVARDVGVKRHAWSLAALTQGEAVLSQAWF